MDPLLPTISSHALSVLLPSCERRSTVQSRRIPFALSTLQQTLFTYGKAFLVTLFDMYIKHSLYAVSGIPRLPLQS